jgi:hypothetical protein
MEDKSIIELKAEVYDKLVLIEKHQISIQGLQTEITEINKKIVDKESLNLTK